MINICSNMNIVIYSGLEAGNKMNKNKRVIRAGVDYIAM